MLALDDNTRESDGDDDQPPRSRSSSFLPKRIRRRDVKYVEWKHNQTKYNYIDTANEKSSSYLLAFAPLFPSSAHTTHYYTLTLAAAFCPLLLSSSVLQHTVIKIMCLCMDGYSKKCGAVFLLSL